MSDSDQIQRAKRKREDGTSLTKAEKRRNARAKRARRQGGNHDHDEVLGLNLGIGRMDSQMLVDYVAQRTKRFEPDLSPVELEDRYLSARCVQDTSSWEGIRDLEHMAAFLESLVDEDLGKVPKDPGSPHTLVISSAGLRAADVTRALRKFEGGKGKVAKLFAKHIKLEESVEMCKKTRMTMGVGTPQRLIDLLEDGALSTKSLKRIVLDASHMDKKKCGILEMKDTQVPLIKLLNLPLLKERYGTDDGIDLVFY